MDALKSLVGLQHRSDRDNKIFVVVVVPLVAMLAVMAWVSIDAGLFTVGLFWLAPAFAAASIAYRKDRGCWWGFWLGWLGVVIAAIIGPGRSRELNELELKQLQLQIRELEHQVAVRSNGQTWSDK